MTLEMANELIGELEDEITELKHKLSVMTDERDIAITHNPTVKECLTECLQTLQELRAYDIDFYNRTPADVTTVESCLSLFVTEAKK